MQKTPFKNINWLSFYDQMNIDFWFFVNSVKMKEKIFLKKQKILHFWMNTGCFVIRGRANDFVAFDCVFQALSSYICLHT